MAALTMRVLVVNAGSSSLKLRLLGPRDEIVAAADVERWSTGDPEPVVVFVKEHRSIDAVGHRVVHGGTEYDRPVLVTPQIREHLARLADLAPLHQPRALAGIDVAASILPGVPAVACFDTAFHAGLPEPAATYPVPAEWRRRWAIRRYGFHGLSHEYAAGRAAQLLGRPLTELRLVTCHLGAGASLAAVSGGRSVDTTMGFTPLEGLVMATRSGSIDPGLPLWLIEHAGLSPAEVTEGLERHSGLAALAGGSGDMRDVLAAADAGDPGARLAFDVYVHRLRREIAAMTASLGGLDAVVFTGGVGEHQPRVRAAAGLAYLGLVVDDRRNAVTGQDADLSVPGSRVRALTVVSREDVVIARQTRRLLAGG
ncbi:acetate/propionate family kinase [Carbonactinospora thermoautotrophica]|uniref:acetate/propionate family kinase n=1 Tax=Carbonactinospora thermoautotrophica TaxID=1469144 RepID=UPI00226E9A56|nr:acetate/propionate family kinase [Carbonactinospora thermoautotrophica]